MQGDGQSVLRKEDNNLELSDEVVEFFFEVFATLMYPFRKFLRSNPNSIAMAMNLLNIGMLKMGLFHEHAFLGRSIVFSG